MSCVLAFADKVIKDPRTSTFSVFGQSPWQSG
jgi:hypothetical protein